MFALFDDEPKPDRGDGVLLRTPRRMTVIIFFYAGPKKAVQGPRMRQRAALAAITLTFTIQMAPREFMFRSSICSASGATRSAISNQ